MARRPRIDVGGQVYHVCNRANLRHEIHFDVEDYMMLSRAIVAAQHSTPMRILSFCFMPNHWHFVVWTQHDGELAKFFQRLSVAHTLAWHARHGTCGTGHVYQGRYRSFLVQTNARLLDVCAYVERNALTAKLVRRAEDWPFGSAFHRERRTPLAAWLWDEWPVPRGSDWLTALNREQGPKLREAIRVASLRGRPYGDENWCELQAELHGVRWRGRGRPKKCPKVGQNKCA